MPPFHIHTLPATLPSSPYLPFAWMPASWACYVNSWISCGVNPMECLSYSLGLTGYRMKPWGKESDEDSTVFYLLWIFIDHGRIQEACGVDYILARHSSLEIYHESFMYWYSIWVANVSCIKSNCFSLNFPSTTYIYWYAWKNFGKKIHNAISAAFFFFFFFLAPY